MNQSGPAGPQACARTRSRCLKPSPLSGELRLRLAQDLDHAGPFFGTGGGKVQATEKVLPAAVIEKLNDLFGKDSTAVAVWEVSHILFLAERRDRAGCSRGRFNAFTPSKATFKFVVIDM